MSFEINHQPMLQLETSQTNATLTAISLPYDDPDIRKQLRIHSILNVQSNQISGLNNDTGEHVLAADFDPAEVRGCALCNNLSYQATPPESIPTIRGFWTQFEDAAARGCKICALILSAIGPCQNPGRVKAYLRPGAALNVLLKSADKNARYEIFTEMGKPVSEYPAIGQARFISQNSSSEGVFDIVRKWIEDCQSHEYCSASKTEYSPTRLIEIRDDHVCLIEARDLGQPYAALSHCWGNLTMSAKATRDNIDALKSGISLGELPRTFQDAIYLCRQLKIQNIWIDSLCIIQDDEDNWNSEAAQMADIYENAKLVISATSAKDGSEGLFTPRKPAPIFTSADTPERSLVREHGPEYKFITDRDEGDQQVTYVVRDMARHAQWDRMWIIARTAGDCNPLLSRAWAYQERLVATRVVHFADHELIWECAQMQRCECMHLDRTDGLPMLERNVVDHRLSFQEATRARGSPETSKLFQLWTTIVERYNERALTFEKDRLPALSGTASRLQKLGLGVYIGGTFLNDFPRCLLWHVPEPGVRPDTYTAPTWSWASVVMENHQPSRVSFNAGETESHPLQHCFERITVLQLSDEPKADPSEAYTMQAAGLRLIGLVLPAQIKIEKLSKPTMTEGGMMPSILHDAPFRDYSYAIFKDDPAKTVSFSADVALHQGDLEMETGSEVFLVMVAQNEYPNHFLVLKKLDSDEDCARFVRFPHRPQGLDSDAYARIGIISSPGREKLSILMTWFSENWKMGVVSLL